MKETQKVDIEIYKKYMVARAQDKSAHVFCNEVGISRGNLYDIIHRVRNGNSSKIKMATEQARLEIYWTYKYEARYKTLPTDRKPSTISELRNLVRCMEVDRFPQSFIAKKLGKNRSTIVHHLTK